MRVAFIGSTALARRTAELLHRRGHEVVVIERDRALIDELTETLDCAYVHGDGTKPAILREVDPKRTDLLFCLTENDETNIIASLVGRSLGFGRVVTRIEDPEFEHICIELGLEDTIIPTRTISRYLADLSTGQDILELSAMVREEIRFFAFITQEADAGPVADLGLPKRARVIYLYRDDELRFTDPETELKPGDEVVLVCHRDELPALNERWNQQSG